MVKLRNILDGVISQEIEIQRKTDHISEWLELHREALSLTSSTKQKLSTFEAVHDDDDEETVQKKKGHKTEINRSLDRLEVHLKRLNVEERKYRSRESMKENEDLHETVREWQSKYRALTTKHHQQRKDLEKAQRQNAERESTMKLLVESHRDGLEQSKKELMTEHMVFTQTLEAEHEAALQRQRDDITLTLERRSKSEMESLTKEMDAMRSEMEALKRGHSEEIEV